LRLARVGGVGHAATNSVDFSLVSRRRGIWAGLIVPLFALSLAISAEPRRVLLIHSLGRDFAPYNSFSVAFRTELASHLPQPLDLFEASLDSARFTQAPSVQGRLAALEQSF